MYNKIIYCAYNLDNVNVTHQVRAWVLNIRKNILVHE